MAVIWSLVNLSGTKDGINTLFSVPQTPEAATLRIIFNGSFLFRTSGSPGPSEYVQTGTSIVLGVAPNSADTLQAMFTTTGVVLSPASVPSQTRKDFYWLIELRDRDGKLLEVLQKDVLSCEWEYTTLGGCSECSISLKRSFDNYGQIDFDYDVQIWRALDPLGILGTRLPAQLPFALGSAATGARELRWSGFVRDITPVLDERESVRLRCSGYSRQLEYLSVYDMGTFGPKTYEDMDVGAIARDIIDNYALQGSRCLRTSGLALMQDTGVIAEELTFDGSVAEALKELAALGGNAEWGVNAQREVYFIPRQNQVRQTYVVGSYVKYFDSTRSADDVVHAVYLRGKDDFVARVTNGAYQSGFQKERTVFAPHIKTTADAELWGTAYFAIHGVVQEKGRLSLAATDDWIENVQHPLGLLRVLGGTIFISGGTRLQTQLPLELGKTLGATTDKTFRIHAIRYTPSENGLRIDIVLGERSNTIADHFRNIEDKLSKLRQGI